MSREDVDLIERAICPGEGACGGMYTANTMASAAEAMGMSLPGSAAPPAVDRRRDGFARRSGEAVVELIRQGITTRDIITKQSLENAIAVVMAFGGSTNAVLHLLAIAHEANVELEMDDFHRIGSKVPLLADVKPFGRYVMSDVDRVGGVPVIMRALLDAGLMHGDCLTVTGRTMAENLADINPPDPDGDILYASKNAIATSGGITILGGSLCPEGAVVKSAGVPVEVFEGVGARVRARAVGDGRARGRHDPEGRRRRHPLRGPQGRPGHARDADDHRGHQGRRPRQGRHAHHRRPVLRRHDRACASATWRRRPSTAARSAWSRTGDRIRIDIPNRTLDLLVDDAELAVRRAAFAPLPPRYTRGVLAKYTRLVGSASRGAVCD